MRICEITTHHTRVPDSAALKRASTLGFDHVLLTGWSWLSAGPEALGEAIEACRAQGLACLLELALDRYPAGSAPLDAACIDHAMPSGGADDTDAHLPGVRLAWRHPELAAMLVPWWTDRLREAMAAGVAGFCCRAPARVAGRYWAQLIGAARREGPRRVMFLAWTPGTSPRSLDDLAQGGFDGAFCSLPWWDYRSPWLAEECERLRPFGMILAAPAVASALNRDAPPRAGTEGDALAARRALWTAAALGDGLLVPTGFETGGLDRTPSEQGTQFPGAAANSAEGGGADELVYDLSYDLSPEVMQANAWQKARSHDPAVAIRLASGPDAPLTVLTRVPAPGTESDAALSIVVNPDIAQPASFGADRILGALPHPSGALVADDGGPGGGVDPGTVLDPMAVIVLPPAGIQLFHAVTQRALAEAICTKVQRNGAAVRAALRKSVEAAVAAPRIAIENVQPACDNGRFAVRRVVGERVEVSADIWMDGHDKLAATLLWRPPGEEAWREAPMTLTVNDRWIGTFPLVAMGRHEFTVQAWRDTYASWCDEVDKKTRAGVDVTLETEEGARLVQAALKTAADSKDGKPEAATALQEIGKTLEAAAGNDRRRLEILLSPQTRMAMQDADTRPFRSHHPVTLPVEADRLAARFASWYELFPRSQSGDGRRHGTFDDVIARLPAIRAMGFDVLYFPPIHPIGDTHRKGRNNSLQAMPDDPGSPYAIGSPQGGHDALHGELGDFDDFRRLLDAAARTGLEIALDFAIQCSPDHPWLREHPEWFAHRPDGSLRYAENPPKKYEDIVNVDFYAASPGAESLWIALRDVVLFWASHGVRLFRVDNPHTKPLPFWEWMIRDVRERYPDAIFLAEAFTRPKMMARLAKLGFAQSYTYFTWRNNKYELTEYLTELTQTSLREYFRPHFFVNTPDINPYFLHDSGRPGFLIRAALATMLSGLWGMYSGFELCEGTPLIHHGTPREEYLDSEKYQLRAWDWDRPGNIVAEISRLNQIRANHPALHSHLGLRFYRAANDAVLYFARFVPGPPTQPGASDAGFGDDVLLVAINLDPHAVHEAEIELPLWEWGLPDHATLDAEDLMAGHRFAWHGKRQRVRLDPAALPFAIWHVVPRPEPAPSPAQPHPYRESSR